MSWVKSPIVAELVLSLCCAVLEPLRRLQGFSRAVALLELTRIQTTVRLRGPIDQVKNSDSDRVSI